MKSGGQDIFFLVAQYEQEITEAVGMPVSMVRFAAAFIASVLVGFVLKFVPTAKGKISMLSSRCYDHSGLTSLHAACALIVCQHFAALCIPKSRKHHPRSPLSLLLAMHGYIAACMGSSHASKSTTVLCRKAHLRDSDRLCPAVLPVRQWRIPPLRSNHPHLPCHAAAPRLQRYTVLAGQFHISHWLVSC